jgi:hypothetical protein
VGSEDRGPSTSHVDTPSPVSEPGNLSRGTTLHRAYDVHLLGRIDRVCIILVFWLSKMKGRSIEEADVVCELPFLPYRNFSLFRYGDMLDY